MLLRELRECGYEGGITLLKEYLATHRPVVTAPEIKRFETEPEYQAQIDWTSVRCGKDRLSAFVATLGHSRFSFGWILQQPMPRLAAGWPMSAFMARRRNGPSTGFALEQPLLMPGAPRWREDGPPLVADLTGVATRQHDLAIDDAIGRAA